MKWYKLVLTLVIILGMFAIPPAHGVNAASVGLTSCIQIQNLDATNEAAINVRFMDQTVAGEISVMDTVPAGGSKTLCPLNSLPDGFWGSAVIESSYPVAVIANLQTKDFSGLMGSYHGFTGGGLTASIPLVKKSDWGYTTQFTVQNIGDASTTVTATYTDGVTAEATIDAGKSYTFNQANEAHVDPSPTTNGGWVGAAQVSSSAEDIAVINLESNNQVLLTNNGFSSADASVNPVFPLIEANWYTYFTGIALQNTEATPTTVTVTYTATVAGTSCQETKDIPANGMTTFAVTAWDSARDHDVDNDCVNGEGFVGSAQVTGNTGNVKLVGIANELSTAKSKGGSYSGFNPASATSTVLFPLITDHNYGFFTGFSFVNVGDTAVDITCTYSGTTKTQSVTNVPIGGAWTVNQYNFMVSEFPSGYVGSGSCIATKTAGSDGGTSPKIVGVLNYLKDSTATDTLLVSEGINN